MYTLKSSGNKIMYSHNHQASNQFVAQGTTTHGHHPSQSTLTGHYVHGYNNSTDSNVSSFNPFAGLSSPYQLGPQPHPQHGLSNKQLSKASSHSGNDEEIEEILPTSSSLIIPEIQDSDASMESGEPLPKTVRKAAPNNNNPRKPRKLGAGRGGRHAAEIRTIFIFENGQWLCPKCRKVCSPRATRMQAHYEKCISSSVSELARMMEVKLENRSGSSSASSTPFNKETMNSASSLQADDGSNSSGDGGAQMQSFPKTTTTTLGKKPDFGGRQKSEVWEYYEEKEEGQFHCRKCDNKVSSKAHRLVKHLAKCINSSVYMAAEPRKGASVSSPVLKSSVTEELKQQFELRNGQWFCSKCGKTVNSNPEKMQKHLEVWCAVSGTMGQAASATLSATSSSIPPKPGATAPHSESSPINLQLGKFIFSSNLPFSILENEEFISFVKLLRGTHKLPSPSDLADSILQEVEEEIQADMKQSLSQKSITLIQCGWSLESNNCENPTIIHALHNGKCSYFLNATQVRQPENDPEECLRLIRKAMEDASSLYSCNVVGVLTDHPKSSNSVREHLQENLTTSVHVYGCFLSLLNSLADEILSSCSELLRTVSNVQEYFSDRKDKAGEEEEDPLSTALREVTILCPADKTLNSYLSGVSSFLDNFEKYKELSLEPEMCFEEGVASVLQISDLYSEAQELGPALMSFAESLQRLESDTATIADAVSCWLSLMNDPHISPVHKEKIQLRFNEGVTPMAIAAYLLHPVFRGQNMSAEVQELGRMWLLERDPMFVVGQAGLERADTSIFPSSFLNLVVAKQMTPAVWWENAGKWPGVPQGLMELAISLMVLPASSRALALCSEPIRTIMSTHNKTLGIDKALKLSNAFFSLRRRT